MPKRGREEGCSPHNREVKVLEQFIEGRSGNPIECEDMVVLSDDYLAVLDGATDEGGQKIEGLSSGLWAARTLARKIADMPGDLGAEEAFDFLSEALPGRREPGARCDAIIFSVARGEIWRVGTVHLLLDGIPYPPSRRIDETTSAARAALNQSLLLGGESLQMVAEEDPGRQLIMPLLRGQKFFANNEQSEWGYGVVDGQKIPSFFLEVFSAKGVSEIVFASDGYPEIFSSLAESEEALARKLQEDPLLLRQPPATKGLRPGNISFDDRAYLRFQP